jgi:hypothetical protein
MMISMQLLHYAAYQYQHGIRKILQPRIID